MILEFGELAIYIIELVFQNMSSPTMRKVKVKTDSFLYLSLTQSVKFIPSVEFVEKSQKNC